MLQGLDPLLGSSPFGYFVAKGGQTTPWTRTAKGILPMPQPSNEAQPAFRLDSEEAPVAVLIGPRASSGEMVELAFVGRAGMRTFGMPSAGFTTANVPYPLSDGAYLVITETTVRDRTGRDHDGAIIPDRLIGPAAAEIAAMEWLTTKCQQEE
jgi:carboxyl-terminal processing protease